MRFWWVSILLNLFVFQLETNPEVRVRITQRGLDYAKDIGMKLLEQELKTRIFPEENGTQNYFFGRADYTVSRIQITSISICNSSVTLTPGNDIKLLIRNVSVTVTTYWTLKTWLFNYQGEVEVSILGLSITTKMIVTQNDRGHLLVSVQNCHFSTGDIEVQLKGGGRWYYNAFVQHLENAIHTRLENQLCLNVVLRIQKEAEVLKRLKGVFWINPFIQVKYSLLKPPEVFKSYVDLDFKVSVYLSGNHTESPFAAAPFPLPEKNDYMLFTGISESLLNSISLTYYTTRVSKITFSEQHSSFFNLTTETLSRIIPQVMQYYTESQPVRMKLMVTAAPTSIGLNASAAIVKQKLIVSLQLQRLHMSLTYSNIGSFQVQHLKNFLSYLLQNTVIPPISAALKRGFQLPTMARLAFPEAVTEVNQGYILISTDVNYKY